MLVALVSHDSMQPGETERVWPPALATDGMRDSPAVDIRQVNPRPSGSAMGNWKCCMLPCPICKITGMEETGDPKFEASRKSTTDSILSEALLAFTREKIRQQLPITKRPAHG